MLRFIKKSPQFLRLTRRLVHLYPNQEWFERVKLVVLKKTSWLIATSEFQSKYQKENRIAGKAENSVVSLLIEVHPSPLDLRRAR